MIYIKVSDDSQDGFGDLRSPELCGESGEGLGCILGIFGSWQADKMEDIYGIL